MYLKASGDNTPAIVLDSFVDAVNEYGLPNKVRSDHGMCWFQVILFHLESWLAIAMHPWPLR